MRQLVLVHGRSQQRRDAVALKAEWLDALRTGLAAGGLTLPIPEADVRFPYYGDTLDALTRGATDNLPEIVVRGGTDPARAAFTRAVLTEVARHCGISDDDVAAEAGPDVTERGKEDWDWFRALLRLLDRSTAAGTASIALFTDDVYRYLTHVGVRDVIDSGVRAAVTPGVETVVVGHSLGSVVTYDLLRRDGAALGWRVPLYVTVGSPLGVGAIRRLLAPIAHPGCAGQWFNAADHRDIVALHPLDATHFPVDPAVENTQHVANPTPNRHGISGYLSDPVVARRIHDALTDDR
jgi:hypothetical protein